ncbi:MAG: O-linked N-acetylglucosamine transferase, SPINDLY family protein [Cyanobacteria bacterium SBLK]|nr:O-linked N-acetylglucosamine transferase, SPINDLY family protein [Cyanobacteria bacterium SBLK]
MLPFCTLTEFSTLHPYDFFLGLGEQSYQERQWEEAIFQYQKVLQEKFPITSEIYYRLSQCYLNVGDFTNYQKILELALEYYPQEGRFYFSLIFESQHQGKIEEAIVYADLAITRIPENYTFKLYKALLLPIIYQNESEIIYYRQRFSQGLDNLIDDTSLANLEELKNAMSRVTNFYISYQAQNDLDLQKRYGNWVTQIISANYPQWSQPLSMPPLTPASKIKIGYASAFLHSYSGTLWLTGWLKYCDRDKFEISCYYTGDTPDKITEEFCSYSDRFYHIPFDLEKTCQQISNDKLHVLIFPEIGMNPQILSIAALRLAPVQCTAWGHPVTTGLPNIDYFLSSELMEKEDAENHYSETLIRLPNIGVSYPKPKIPPLLKTRNDFQLPEHSIIYLCCQAPFKYLPQYDRIFPEIALQMPQAKFLFLRGKLLKSRLERIFTTYNLNYLDYCIFKEIPDRLGYLSINLLSDVYLDTFTWSGGNTSLEAIACHLPLVTCPGDFMRSRHTYSFLKMIDLTETIARDREEYIKIAVKLGQDKNWRDKIVKKMKENCDRLYSDRECIVGLEKFFTRLLL